jgi:hypothetical protein
VLVVLDPDDDRHVLADSGLGGIAGCRPALVDDVELGIAGRRGHGGHGVEDEPEHTQHKHSTENAGEDPAPVYVNIHAVGASRIASSRERARVDTPGVPHRNTDTPG